MLRLFWNNILNGFLFQIKYTWYSLKRWPTIIILYLVCICFLGALEPVEVYFQKEIISNITNEYDSNLFYSLIGIYFLVSVLFLFQSYASPIVQKIIGLKIASWIDGKIYRTMQSVPMQVLDSVDFQVKFNRASKAVVHISSGPALLMYSLSYVIALVIPTVQLLRFPMLLSVYYMMGLLIAINNAYHSQRAEELRKAIEVDKRALRYYSKILEHKNVMIETRVHRFNEYFHRKWEELTETFFQKQMQLKRQQVKEFLGVSILQQMIAIVPIGILYFLITQQKVDIATYTLTTGMGTVIIRYIGYLFNALSKSANCGIYTDDIDEVLNYNTQPLKTVCVDTGKAIVELKGVSFQYIEGQPVLENINFHIREKEIVAIVGENGSGKTTLSNLILGLYKPKSGKMMIYDQDVTAKNINLTGIISPVFQDYSKYEFSVRENIGYGNIENINDDLMINDAMLQGGFYDIYASRSITLDTYLGKRYETGGEELSGGEWQRVAISRGVFGNSKLIILDEPTASLDPLSEISLFNQIKDSLDDKAAVIISHRIGICKLADRIVFIENGRIVEQGTHTELYTLKGKYYDFFNEQSKWYEWGEKSEVCKT